MDKKETSKKFNCFINIIIAEFMCVSVILTAVFAIKYFFKNEYREVKTWYNQEVATNTDVNEVLK